MALYGATLSPADAAPLRIRGESTFAVAQVAAADDGLLVSGSLRDDGDRAIAKAKIQLEGAVSRPCSTSSTLTDSSGSFCFFVPGAYRSPNNAPAVKLFFSGNDYFGPTDRRVELVVSDVRVNLRLELESPRWDLSRETHQVSIVRTDEGSPRDRFPVQLSLIRNDEEPKPLTRATLDSEGRSSVSLASSDLGAPGPVRLVAQIETTGRPSPEAEVAVTLVSPVRIEWVTQPTEARPSSGFDTQVRVRSLHGPVNSGWIESHVGETVVGIGEVQAGVATVRSRFRATRRPSVAFSVRYLPEHPWWMPVNRLTAELKLLPPSPWQHLPWMALALGVIWWVVKTWRRPLRRRLRSPSSDPTAVKPRPGIRVLESDGPKTGWQGVVRDVHTQTPIRAQVSLHVPSVDQAEACLARAECDALGRFELSEAARLPEGARLIVTAADYTTIEQAVPPPGRLDIGLMTRRRYLLEQLTAWATQRGAAWSQATPRRVAKLAAKRGERSIERWALDIEDAAYGPRAPGDRDERALKQRTPPLDRS